MGDAVVAAVVAGVVSVLVSVGKTVWDTRQHDQERRRQARASLDTFRQPLLASVDDLGSRINNMRHHGFLNYLEVPERRRTALVGTLFRFAQFLGWTEIVHGSYDRLRFESDEDTKAVVDLLSRIGRTLAVDRLDRLDPEDFTTAQLMLWREEQRAIGDAMRTAGDSNRCRGFASFARGFDEEFAPWFASFANQLTAQFAARSERFAEVQRHLAQLVARLDVDELLVHRDPEGTIVEPMWARPEFTERG